MRLGCLAGLLSVCLLGMSVYHSWRSVNQPCECEMTYMYPKFEQVYENGRYALHKYIEARIPGLKGGRKEPRAGHLPALFIPGNSGSFRQVRSIASETTRHFQKAYSKYAHDLTWYAADFNEELSALDGSQLVDQTAFVIECLTWLVDQYRENVGIPKILIVGHSMGGLVARAAIAQAVRHRRIDPQILNLVITFASPHAHVSTMTHRAMSAFYTDLYRDSDDLQVPVISISGGPKDVQVTDNLASLQGLLPEGYPYLQVQMQHMENVWLSGEHQCTVWCNELIVRLGPLILELTHQSLKQDDSSVLKYTVRTAMLTALANLKMTKAEHLDPVPFKEVGQKGCKRTVPEEMKLSGSLNEGEFHVDELDGRSRYFQMFEGGRTFSMAIQYPDESFSVLVGAAKPCASFRVWLGSDEGLTEVTGYVKELPPADPSARFVPLKQKPTAVLKGLDYVSRATWSLVLSAEHLRPFKNVTVWVGQPSFQTTFFLHAEFSHQTRDQQNPKLDFWTIFQPVHIKAPHPIVLRFTVPYWIRTWLKSEVSIVKQECSGQGIDPPWNGFSVWSCKSDIPNVNGEFSKNNGVKFCRVAIAAPPLCSISVQFKIPVLQCIHEYFLTNCGQLMGLAFCWCGLAILTQSNRDDYSANAHWMLLGCTLVFYTLVDNSEFFHAIFSALNLWKVPESVKYPVFVRVVDLVVAWGLVEISRGLVAGMIWLGSLIWKSLQGAVTVLNRLLHRTDKPEVKKEKRGGGKGRLMMVIVMCAMGMVHPGIASFNALMFAMCGGCLAPRQFETEHSDQDMNGDAGWKMQMASFHFWGWIQWLPPLVARIKLPIMHKSWSAVDTVLALPSIWHAVFCREERDNTIALKSWSLGFAAQSVVAFCLAMTLNGYSALSSYLYPFICITQLVLNNGRKNGDKQSRKRD